MKKLVILTILFILFILACSQTKNGMKSENGEKLEVSSSKVDQSTLAKGFNLVEKNCFSCHSANPSIKEKLAPSMAEIKQFYILPGKTEADFNKSLSYYLQNPSKAETKITSAIEKYGSMPKMNFSETDISQMAYFIYQSNVGTSDWYFEKYGEVMNSNDDISTDQFFLSLGSDLALKTQGVLGKKLKDAINTSGPEQALSFCSAQAIPITDSTSLASHAMAKRVTDKNRNPNNKANASELEYIHHVKQELAKGSAAKPKLIKTTNGHTVYYPIITNQFCLQCHGNTKSDIAESTLQKIKELYPEDNATGYQSGELRGIWVINMEN